MAVVINAKGTSVAQFQIGKQGPIIKNNSGIIEFTDNTDTDLQVQILSTANAVNNLTLTGSATGNDATIAVVGTDTNINIKLVPKGTGEIVFGDTATNTSLTAGDNASGSGFNLTISAGNSTGGGGDGGDVIIVPGTKEGAGIDGKVCITDQAEENIACFLGTTGNDVNYFEFTSAITTANPKMAVVGTDTNIDITIEPKGSGQVILGSTAAVSSLQADDNQDLFVTGGDSNGSADAGDLILEGGNGSGAFAPGDVVIRGGSGGTGTSFITLDSGVVVGSATGGDQGAGTINATAFYINGNQLPTILTGSNTLDFASIASLGEADLTITVTGATVGDEVALGLPAAPTSGIVFNAFVSASDTVTVRAHNYTAGAIDPASATYSVRVFQ